MRIRSIKPGFWRSDDVTCLPWDNRLLFIGLWSYVDDNGVGIDKLALIAADLFAADVEREPSETFARVSRGLQSLADSGRITRYTIASKALLYVTNWDLHQRIDKPNKPRYPLPTRENDTNHATLAPPSRNPRESPSPGVVEERIKGEEEERGSLREPERGHARATRLPADWQPADDLASQMSTECPGIDLRAEHRKFVDHWKAQPGQKGVKADWSATWRNWMRRANEGYGGVRSSNGAPRTSRSDADFAHAESLKHFDVEQKAIG